MTALRSARPSVWMMVVLICLPFCLGLSAQSEDWSSLGSSLPQTKNADAAYLSPYPSLTTLGPDDAVFAQLQDSERASLAKMDKGKPLPDLVFFRYRVPRPLDLASLATRLNISLDSLATLNSFENPRSLLGGESVLVPSQTGLFVPLVPLSDLDVLIAVRGKSGSRIVEVNTPYGKQTLRYYPAARFSAEENAEFQGRLAAFPLARASLNLEALGSNPSRTQARSASAARDSKLAAPGGVYLPIVSGAPVYAVASGIVSEAGFTPLEGYYLVLAHGSGFKSYYGHLSSAVLRLNDRVESGMIVGRIEAAGGLAAYLHFAVIEADMR